jgi:hypothetical protein
MLLSHPEDMILPLDLADHEIGFVNFPGSIGVRCRVVDGAAADSEGRLGALSWMTGADGSLPSADSATFGELTTTAEPPASDSVASAGTAEGDVDPLGLTSELADCGHHHAPNATTSASTPASEPIPVHAGHESQALRNFDEDVEADSRLPTATVLPASDYGDRE